MPYTVQIEFLDRNSVAMTYPIVREAASEDEARRVVLAVIEDVRQALQPVVISAFNPSGGLIESCSVDYRAWAKNPLGTATSMRPASQLRPHGADEPGGATTAEP